MAHTEQNFENHARYVPAYHYVAYPILLLNFGWTAWNLRDPSFPAVLDGLVAVALLLVTYYARSFPLKAQDRVIRLEMRLRMRDRLPEDLQGRIDEFTPTQMVGLRFAGDDELPDLAREVLDRNLTQATPIKKRITDWQADHYRV